MRYWICLFVLFLCLWPLSSAFAAVEFCNRLASSLEVSFAYPKNMGVWASKGWYAIPAGECQIVHAQDDMGEVGGKAMYYYYAVAFMGEDQLTWAGTEEDGDARNFCLKNDVFDIEHTNEACASQGYTEKLFLPMSVTVAPSKKHIVRFNPPEGIAAAPGPTAR